MFSKLKFILFFCLFTFQVSAQASLDKENIFEVKFESGKDFFYSENYDAALNDLLICKDYIEQQDRKTKFEFYEILLQTHFGRRDFLNMYVANTYIRAMVSEKKDFDFYLKSLLNEGIVLREYKDFKKAEELFKEVKKLLEAKEDFKEDKDLFHIYIWTNLHLANLYNQSGEYDLATKAENTGLFYIENNPQFKFIEQHFLYEIVNTKYHIGPKTEAKNDFIELLAKLKENEDIDYDQIVDIDLKLAEIDLLEKDSVSALERLKLCLSISDSVGLSKHSIKAAQLAQVLNNGKDQQLSVSIFNVLNKKIVQDDKNRSLLDDLISKKNKIVLLTENIELNDKNNRLLIFAVLLVGLVFLITLAFLFEKIKDNKRTLRLNERLEKSNEKLYRTNSKLEILNRNLNRFSSLVAHDVKSPLRNIASFNKILGSSLSKEKFEDQHEFIDLVNQEVKNLSIFVEDLLEFSKFTNQEELILEKVHLNDIVQESIQKNLADINENNIDVNLDLTHSLNGSKKLLILCFQNFISNSIKFSSSERESKVWISSSLVDDKIIISVKDNGIGVDKESIQNIFKNKQRAKNAKELNIEGYGIGLSTVKTILDIHNAKVSVRSQLDEYTEFTIRFDIATELA